MDFDTEKFIYEVEKRPCLWNLKCTEYSDRIKKIQGWEEIVIIFGGTDLSMEEKKTLGQVLQKKWKNIRDNFSKYLKKEKYPRSGSSAKGKSTYIFAQQLMFLKDTITLNATETSINIDETDNLREGPYTDQWKQNPNKRMKESKTPESDSIGRELLKVLNKNIHKNNENDQDTLFFLSLVKEFKKIPEHLQMEKKIEIMRVIKSAQPSFYDNSQYAQGQPSWENQGRPQAEYGHSSWGHHQRPNRGYTSGYPPTAQFNTSPPLTSPVSNSEETHISGMAVSPESISSQTSEVLGLFN